MIRAEQIVSGYGKQEILHGVDLEVLPKGITAIFGPNGSGKSTLLKVLAGVVEVWRGRLYLGDIDITRQMGHRRTKLGISTVPQGGRVFRQLSVEENLLMGAYLVRDRREVARRKEWVLNKFPDLGDRLRQPAGTLSGGQQMLLSLARALMLKPKVLLLDEPSAGLAPAVVVDVFATIRALADSGIPVVLVEQNVRQALRISDRVYILVQGEVRFVGSAEELAANGELMELYLGIELERTRKADDKASGAL